MGVLVKFSWQGGSGHWYEFEVARDKPEWSRAGGVYLFVKPGDTPKMEAGGPVCLYAAIAESFEDSLTRHEMWQAAHALGAKEVHLLALEEAVQRERALKDIQRAHTPILNQQILRRVA
jgi:hypothetical protein